MQREAPELAARRRLVAIAAALALVVILTAATAGAAGVPSTTEVAGTAGATAPFRDLDASHWAAAPVAQAVALGLISGYPDGTFRPDRSVSRAEFIKLATLGRRLLPAAGDGGFSDVAEHWLATSGYLQAAVDAGLVVPSDYGDPPRLDPDRPITRVEVAMIGTRFLHKQAAMMVLRGAPLPFTDAVPGWASGAVAVARSTGVLGGYPDGSFGGDRRLTRAEAAAVAVRLVGIAAAEGTLPPPPAPPPAPSPASPPAPSPRPVPVWEANSWQVRTPSPAGLTLGSYGTNHLAAAADGTLYLALGDKLWQWSPGGRPSQLYQSPDGPVGPIAVAADGSLFAGHGLQVLRIAGGQATPWAGSGDDFVADGAGLQASFEQITDLALCPDGNLYVTEGDWLRRVRRIDPAGHVTTLAGLSPLSLDALVGTEPPSEQRAGGTPEGPGALIPLEGYALACDGANNLYLGGNALARISPDGNVTAVAGGPHDRADGLAAEAGFSRISAMTVDPWGDLWIADWGNHRIRRLTPDGHVYTVAGGGEREVVRLPGGGALQYIGSERDGSGPDARFNSPAGVALVQGSLYVLQSGGSLLRRIDGDARPYGPGEALAPVPAAWPDDNLPASPLPWRRVNPGLASVPLALYTPVEQVSLSVDGEGVARGGDPVYTLTWEATGASGAHTLQPMAKLPGGDWQAGAEYPLAVTSDSRPYNWPQGPWPPAPCNLLAPGSDSWLRGTVRVTASGDGSPLTLRVDGRAVLAQGSATLLAADWDTTAVSDGEHQLEIGCFDPARQESFYRWAVVHVMNEAAPTPPDNGAAVRVYLGGQFHRYREAQPRLVDGVPYLPFTETLQFFGYYVNWDGSALTLLAWRPDSPERLLLHLDTGLVEGPGGNFSLDRPPLSAHNNTLVPYTLFAALGHAGWYEATQRSVHID